jgi:carboxylesterase type B
LRFEAAQPIDNLDDCWNGTLLAHNSSETCLQKNDKGEIIGSEDCLYMDIVTPEVRYINLLPVIVLVGTNNYANGTPGILRPSAKYARSRSVVYVRPNFRMGVLGFLALESLSNSSAIPSSGNYALTDLIAALEWIKINIQHFGGDPKSVTIFGHRTGATLATALTAIPKANKLFSGVWASSGSFRLPGDPLEVFEKNNLEYAGLYPTIKDKSAWQEIDALELVNKTPSTWTKEHIGNLPTYYENSSDFHDWIVQDGVYLKEHPVDVWKSSKNIPKIVIGTTAHAAFDISKDSFLSKNLTEEEIVTYVKDSKIGRLNLTEEAFKRYGKTREGKN